jgi:hypothetical protein
MKRWLMGLLLCFGISQAMVQSNKKPKKHLVTLPSADILVQRLKEAGFSDFIERTNKIEKLGGQLKSPWKVFLTVDIALYKAYEKNSSDYEKAMEMQMKKLDITHLILQDFPEAIERLAQTGIVLKTSKEEQLL